MVNIEMHFNTHISGGWGGEGGNIKTKAALPEGNTELTTMMGNQSYIEKDMLQMTFLEAMGKGKKKNK